MDATPATKFEARRLVQAAIYHGALKRLPCIVCGSLRAHGHHPDYSKPLEVVWLCIHCHNREHVLIKYGLSSALPVFKPCSASSQTKLRLQAPRKRKVSRVEELLRTGMRPLKIAQECGLSPQRIYQVRDKLEKRGLYARHDTKAGASSAVHQDILS